MAITVLALALVLLPDTVYDTLRSDDGVVAGGGYNGDTLWIEAVELGVRYDANVLAFGYYPYRADTFITPYLHSLVFDETLNRPGNVLYDTVIDYSSDTVYNWVWFGVTPFYYPPGKLFAGWADDSLHSETDWYSNAYDTNLDYHNWWYNSLFWQIDSVFPGDFLVRAYVEYFNGAAEVVGPSVRTISAGPVPVKGRLSYTVTGWRPVEALLYDAAGKQLYRGGATGSLELWGYPTGTYVLLLKSPTYSEKTVFTVVH